MINKDMTIMEIIIQYPQTKEVFEKFDMGCSVCMAAMDETIEAGAKMHGLQLDKLLSELNNSLVK